MKFLDTIKLFFPMFCLLMAAMTANAQDDPPSFEQLKLSPLLLQEKLEYYKNLYPDILFLVFEGGDGLLDEIMALDLILGYQPKNLDYEHPEHLRTDLLYVSVERVIQMLRNHAPSATLFQADNPLGWQEHVCVLTLSPRNVAADSLQATRHLLNLSRDVIQNIPDKLQLLADDYLGFVFDHEVYHCLKSRYIGPQQRSHKTLWAEYNHFLNEQGADAYALAMHLRNHGRLTSFAQNLPRIRAMALFNGDPDHLTCKALEQVLNLPVERISNKNAHEIFALANRIREQLTPGYDEYLQFLASAVQAMKKLGVDARVSKRIRDRLQTVAVDTVQVNNLVDNSRRCLAELRGENQ